MKKSTQELINELKEFESINSFLNENENEFTSTSLSDYISRIIEQKGLKKSEIVKCSGLSEVYAYEVLSGKKNPTRDKLICIAFALRLNEDETSRLLTLGGKNPLYIKDRRDGIIIFALNKHITLQETNDLLFELNEQTF